MCGLYVLRLLHLVGARREQLEGVAQEAAAHDHGEAGDDEQQTMVDMQRLRRVKGLTEAQERIDALRSELGGAPVDEPETRLDVIARGGNTSGMGMGMGTQEESLSSSNPHRGD